MSDKLINPENYLQSSDDENHTGYDSYFLVWNAGRSVNLEYGKIYYGTLDSTSTSYFQDLFDPYTLTGNAGRYRVFLSAGSDNFGLPENYIKNWVGAADPSFSFRAYGSGINHVIAESEKDNYGNRVIELIANNYFNIIIGVGWDAYPNFQAKDLGYGVVALKNSNPTGSIFIEGEAIQGETLTANNNLYDPDGIGLINYQWKADGHTTQWSKINSYTLTESDVGKNISVEISYFDGFGFYESAFSSATEKIANINDAPVLAKPLADQSVTAGNPLSYTVPADSFTDVDHPTLAYNATLANGQALPAWLTFNPASLTFSGTPTSADLGTLSVRVAASDGSLSASDTFDLTVNSLVNRITGTPANDRLQNTNGNDNIDGRTGIDTVIYSAASSNYSLQLTPTGIQLRDQLGRDGVDTLVNVELLEFTDKTVDVRTQAHGSYADLPDTLYQFFVVGFGAAAGVTYMDQMADAYRWWHPTYGNNTVKQIVEVFTTKTQFTRVYPEAMYREDHGKYYLYRHDTTQPGSPLVKSTEVSKSVFDAQMSVLAQRLIDTIVKDSATASAKEEAVNDVRSALNLGGDWTIGKVVYTIFGNLANKPLNDAQWGGTAQQFANQVAVSKYYTEVLSQSTDDLGTLRDVMRAVTHTSDVSTDDNIASLIGVALMNDGLT